MASTYLAKAKNAENVEHGNAVTISRVTDDARILERNYLGSADSSRYNSRVANASSADHNHNSLYASISHNHDASYSAIGHDHDTDYMPSVPWADTFWDDARVAVSSVRVQGQQNIPDWGAFMTNLQILWFDPSTMQQVFFAIQLSHAYKLGTDLYPHVHWVPASSGSAGQVVSWGLEYSFGNVGQTFPPTNTIYGNAHMPSADTSLVANRQYRTPLTTIDGSAINGMSFMFVCRLFRDATGAGATDSYEADAGLLEFDMHYEIDSPGSDSLYTK